MFRSLAGAVAYARPTFMLPAVGTSLFGAALAPTLDARIAALHAGAVGTALFVAHLRDGYVDGHLRGEEEPSLSVPAFRAGVLTGTVGAGALAGALAALANPLAAVATAALLCLALLHAPYLDRRPIPVTVDYPVGIALTVYGGYAAQTAAVPPGVVAVATVLALLLAGVKVGIDRLDAAFDRTIGKRTVPVVFGAETADRIAAGVFGATAVSIPVLVAAGVLPPASLVASVVPVACGVASVTTSPERAVRAQMALAYVFVSILFVALCGGDCAGRSAFETILFGDVEQTWVLTVR